MESILNLANFVIFSFVYLFIAFVIVMRLEHTYKDTKLYPILKIVVGIPAILFDWFVNMTAACIVWWDLPAHPKEVVTGRLKRYKEAYLGIKPSALSNKASWQLVSSIWLCNILNKYDNGHC